MKHAAIQGIRVPVLRTAGESLRANLEIFDFVLSEKEMRRISELST